HAIIIAWLFYVHYFLSENFDVNLFIAKFNWLHRTFRIGHIGIMMLVFDITFSAHNRAIVFYRFMDITGTLGWRQMLMLPNHHRLHTSFALLRRELTTIWPLTYLNRQTELIDHFWGDTC